LEKSKNEEVVFNTNIIDINSFNKKSNINSDYYKNNISKSTPNSTNNDFDYDLTDYYNFSYYKLKN